MHNRKAGHHATSRGFTLIEVMITVAIVAILGAVAYPSYRDYIVRGQLVDATTALATYRADMERHYQDNRSFATVGAFTTPCAAGTDASRTVGNFLITCAAVAADSYTVRAAGSGSVNGFTYTITHQDVRATTAVPSGSGYVTCATRWILKKGQSCS